MKLSDEQRRILRVVECAADLPVAEVARLAKVRPHVAQYHCSRFRAQGILRSRLFINTYRLGYTRYAIFFSMPGARGTARSELIAKLKKHTNVALLLEVGGEFQFEINLVVRFAFELQQFLDWVSKECGESLGNRAVCVQLAHRLFGMKCLWNSTKGIQELSYGVVPSTVLLDATDHQILTQYRDSTPSLREVGAAVGIAPSTVEQRLRRLRSNGVISGAAYLIEGLPIQSWVILVHTNGLSPADREGIVNFGRVHQLVHYSVESLGGWDVELGVTAFEPDAPTRVVEDLYQSWGARITRLQVLPLFARHKVVDYPFSNPPVS